MKLFFAVCLVLALASCAHATVPPVPNPYPETETACKSHGGQWVMWEMRPTKSCIIPAMDAGKNCSDGDECQSGYCIGKEHEKGGKCYENLGTIAACKIILVHGIPQQQPCL